MDNIIKCPVCGQEYLPSEIYMPKEFFGNPGQIMKNDQGQIEFILGKGMNLEEEYTCDNCENKFKVKASISFESELCKAETIEEEYISHINRPKKIKLVEEELF